MVKISKKRKEIISKIDNNKFYKLDEAVDIVKQNAKANFDETIDLAINLSLNSSKSDQSVKGVVNLPNGIGKKVRVAVIAKGEKAEEAKKAGADLVGDLDLLKSIESGEINFEILIATPDMMAEVGKHGKILGPKGLMPNPKLGTVTMDLKNSISNIKNGQVQFKNDKAGIVHAGIGKVSFEKSKLIENISSLFNEIYKNKPDSIKGNYVKRVSVASSMGFGIKVNVEDLQKNLISK